MDESFERRPLLDRERLRSLQTRSDLQSTLHLALQVLAFVLCAAGIVGFSDRPVFALPLAIALGGITASFFAPFHECIHQTAFRTRRANRVAAWIAAIPFGMAPSVYRVFHWEHHRHTQDPESDPEILRDPNSLSPWPQGTGQWLRLWSGSLMFAIKTVPSVLLAVIPVSRWDSFAPWAKKDERRRLAWESRAVVACWLGLALAAATGVRGTAWILGGMLLSHMFLAFWLAAEHRGLPHDGTIFARTRTMHPSRFVQWWLWNMNFHAEHHAWPAIPWHRLPETHRDVAAHVEQQGNAYWRLHADRFRKRRAA